MQLLHLEMAAASHMAGTTQHPALNRVTNLKQPVCVGGLQVKVQEQSQCLEPGRMPCAITVVLQDELADSLQPGGERMYL